MEFQQNQNNFNFENYEIETRFIDKVKSLENKNVVGTICEISKLLEQNGCLLESTKRFPNT